ncbi:MAG: 30S ribosomal protein S12 methylthiotransferase RimO, partial [Planctomycetia bacterium]|nr:30S ribosomal protein S12 methylthiotransferase RimO [Planctomycetia bacterium]
IEAIDELLEAKKSGKVSAEVGAGCMPQRYGPLLLEMCPGIDAVVGLGARERLSEICRRVLAGTEGPIVDVAPARGVPADGTRMRLTPRHYAYVRISEGCDNRCSYCTIPFIRGPFRSKQPDHIVAEVEELIADGAKEIILIGQDTTSYGRDIGDGWTLARLLRRIVAVDGLVWLRLLYAHPASFGEDLMDVFSDGEALLPYIDLPLQHINDRILKSMGRRVTRADIEALLEKLRSRIQNLTLRTSFIVGYPGETEAEFKELLEFVRRVEFERLGSFAYSLEDGTPAAGLGGQVAPETRFRRQDTLMRLAAGISLKKNRALIGKELTVLIDEPSDEEVTRPQGRHAGIAPDVDGTVLVEDFEAQPGDFLDVRITSASEYDLGAELANELRLA